MLGITGPDDVAKMGIEKYNNECRKIVMRYAGEWEVITDARPLIEILYSKIIVQQVSFHKFEIIANLVAI